MRLQLELLKPEMTLAEQEIISTIVVFGSTQIVERPEAEARVAKAKAALADEARAASGWPASCPRMQRLLDKCTLLRRGSRVRPAGLHGKPDGDRCDFVMTTGGGPGIMEAANRGAFDVGAKSVGLQYHDPAEQMPNPYITPELCFQFHYFALRKMHFLLRAKALVAFPGGFGTLDEMFDTLTLRQTRRMQSIPVILFGRDYWQRVIDFQFLADEGVIEDRDLNLISYADTPQEAWETIVKFYQTEVEP